VLERRAALCAVPGPQVVACRCCRRSIR
jgi:hypothetical protein